MEFVHFTYSKLAFLYYVKSSKLRIKNKSKGINSPTDPFFEKLFIDSKIKRIYPKNEYFYFYDLTIGKTLKEFAKSEEDAKERKRIQKEKIRKGEISESDSLEIFDSDGFDSDSDSDSDD